MLQFNTIAIVCIISWVLASVLIWGKASRTKTYLSHACSVIGLSALLIFIVNTWIAIDRPPMRTLGETRMWYSFFLPAIGFIAYLRWRYKWLLWYCFGMGILFLIINISRPENFDKSLMPALQSAWFVPHVVVYMIAYALLGVSCLMAVKGLYQIRKQRFNPALIDKTDNIVYMGVAMLGFGLIFGAIWAKEAWGHYWTWDPKETWAMLTWLVYLVYMHYRKHRKKNYATALYILSFSYLILLLCWFGLNYMATAMNSVHTYTM